jgi:hypothetical protein
LKAESVGIFSLLMKANFKLLVRYSLLLALLVIGSSLAFAQGYKPQPNEIATSRPSPEFFQGFLLSLPAEAACWPSE